MNQKALVAYVGFFLVIIGVVLISVQQVQLLLDPLLAAEFEKACDVSFTQIKCHTNVLGFGVLVVGAILLWLGSDSGKTSPLRRRHPKT